MNEPLELLACAAKARMWLRAENRDDRKDCQRARFKFEKLAHVQSCMMEFAGASMRRRR